jgi:imidazolonepropionase-like amidohydrolase
VAIAAGTDAFDSYLPLGPSLPAELAQLVATGMSPKQALLAGTRTAARVSGFAASRGTIAVGKAGDLVLLDADPTVDIAAIRRINAVIHRGRVLDRAALDRMLEGVRDLAGR